MTSGIEITLKELIDLRWHAIHHSLNNANKRITLPGQKMSRVRGRGIDFDTTREYQLGDDIRHMAWRVTARSLKPHIKVYQEEKERPVWLAMDLSPSLYFGTRCMFKSVRSIKQAACIGWSALMKREQIGAMIAAEEKIQVYKPQSGERNFLTILRILSESSRQRPSYTEANHLQNLLITLQQQVRTGHLIYIASDFFHFNDHIQKLILHIAQCAQVILQFIYDPIEAQPPPPHKYTLTNGQQKILFNMHDAQSRSRYQQQFQQKENQLIAFSHKHNIALEILSTDQNQEE